MPAISGTDRQFYLERLRAGDTHAIAARVSGHARTSYNRIADRDDLFRAAREEATKAGIEVLEQQLVSIGLGNVEAKMPQVVALFGVLKARDPAKWSEKRQLEVGGKDGKPVEVAIGVSYREVLETLRRIGAEPADGDAGSGNSVPGAGEVLPADNK